MRFLSVAACALAASLLSASPSQAIVVESHYLTGPHQFTVYGPIPEPIEILIGLSWNPEKLYDVDFHNGVSIQAFVSTSPYSYAYLGEIITNTGSHYPDFPDNTFTLTNTDRTVSVTLLTSASENWIINDAYVYFNLPDNLSIAAPVPEPSTWAMLILGFAGIALIRRYRPSRADRVTARTG